MKSLLCWMRKSVDAARAEILREKCGNPNGAIIWNTNVDLSLFPPCQKTLHVGKHIRRAYYQVGI